MIQIPQGTKGLIFDLDGTIANTMQNHFTSWRKAVLPHGINFDQELFMSLTGMPRFATIEKLNALFGTKMNLQEVSNAKAAEYKKLSHLTKEITVVTDVIKKYHGILPMSIGTGSTKKGAKNTLKTIGFDSYFDIVITADDIKNPKPHPETFLKCAELMGIKPKNCVVFEDGELSMIAARKAGMKVIDINDYFKIEFTI